LPEWECEGATNPDSTGSITGSPVIEIPDLTTTAYLPESESQGDDEVIGIVLFPFNNQAENDRPDYLPDESPNDLSSQIQHYSDVSENGGDIETASVACWAGSLDEKPNDVENSDRSFVTTGVNLGNHDPVQVTDTVTSGNHNGYSCEWQYEVTDFDDPVKGGEVIALHDRENSDYLEEMRDAGANIPE